MRQYTQIPPLMVVCVAAPEDAQWLGQWEHHLQPLEQAGLISLWSELHLVAGASREQEYRQHLENASLILLLLSADFFHSPDCLAMMEHALERSRTGASQVIPLLLRSVTWQESPLGILTPWPSNEKPITLWSNQDEGWYACVLELRRLLGRQVSLARSSTPPQKHTDPDWERMLRRLRRSYKELLDQSLHGIAWVQLGLSTRPDLVSNVTNLLFRLPQGGERLLTSGTRMLNAYDEAEEELLILGAPGAGKSTLLLDLAQQLVARALADPAHPLPVILRLSSWAVQRPALAEWMIEQLSRTYDVPRQLSERWVKQGRLIPLLDGLDEMEEATRPACIAAINSYHRTHLTPLVVCSRQADYEVAATRERLVLQSAVIVQPLNDEQIEGYLHVAGPSFAGIQVALSQEQTLRALATTPLMLSMLLLTYRGTTVAEILQPGTALERQVWTDYVARQVAEKGNEISYPLPQTHSWLSWLAQQMQAHQQTIFYAEHLQLDWLPSTQQRFTARHTTFIPSIVIGICVSLLVSIFLLYATPGIFLLQMGILGGFIGGCFNPSVIESPTQIGKRPQARTIYSLLNALLLGGLLVASFGFYLHQANPSSQDSGYFLSDWLREGCIFGLGSLLSGWIFQLLINRLPKQRVSVPQMRIGLRGRLVTWMNTIGSLRIWQAGIALGTGIWLSFGLITWLRVELILGLGDGLSFGLNSELGVGLSVIVIVILVRLILDISFSTLRFAERIHWTWHSFFRLEHLWTTMMVVTVLLFIGLRDEPVSGLSVGLSYWLLLGLYQGAKQEHLEDQNRSEFNQGIRQSLRNGILISLISAVIIALMDILSYGLIAVLILGLVDVLSHMLGFELVSRLSDALSHVLGTDLSYGLSVGLIVLVTGTIVMWALSGGPTVLRHYVIRWLLARHRTFPWRAQAFLDDATTRILLRRVGGGYSFIHRRLQDYFAETAVLPPQE